MVEAGPGSGENDLPAAGPEARHDFSSVQGFQVVGADNHGAAHPVDGDTWRDALRLELEARAARFHQAVDSAIVLSNDGVIRWLGDPVARLARGPGLLSPNAVILADESLPDASRDTVRMRVELWIAATTRRVLAPLFALEALEEGPEAVRDLAGKLARSLGILEREPLRAEINALSQNDRAELRKQGVRFGAYYLFVPALIKPAPRTLALQLWGLRASGDAGELLRALAPVAASGRTSLALDTGISHEGYRVAGYRPCGERVVRVDIIERLSGMIRAAIAGERPGVAPEDPSPPQGRPSPKGFVVNGQMTSLTGCSGEQFASILRSMRFQPVEMKRSEFFGAPADESRGQPAPIEAADWQTSKGSDPPPAQETSEDEAAIDPIAASDPALLDDVQPLPDGDPSPASPDPSGFAGAEAHGAEEDPASQASGPDDTQTSDAGTIIVWRPDRRRIRPNRGRAKTNRSSSAKPRRSDAGDLSQARPAKGRRPEKWRPETGKAPGRADRGADQPGIDINEKHRQQASDRDMRSNPAAGAQPRAKVDPNSPFAKLLELRSLLEEQAAKRP
jgi:ATP-dependent RNA helicase SUPV3L1/SUV3